MKCYSANRISVKTTPSFSLPFSGFELVVAGGHAAMIDPADDSVLVLNLDKLEWREGTPLPKGLGRTD